MANETPRGKALSERLGRLITLSRRRVWGAAAQALQERGESVLDWQIVRQLSLGGPSKQRELAEAIAQHPAGVSRQLDELEQKGLIRRVAAQEDRRCRLVELTDAGRRWYRTQSGPVFDAVDRALAPLGAGEQQALFALLTQLVGDGAR